MRYFLLLAVIAGIPVSYLAQNSRIDSLAGFNEAAAAMEAHRRNYTQADLKGFVNLNRSEFLKNKFNLQQTPGPAAGKLGSGLSVANAPCLNEGFEGLL